MNASSHSWPLCTILLLFITLALLKRHQSTEFHIYLTETVNGSSNKFPLAVAPVPLSVPMPSTTTKKLNHISVHYGRENLRRIEKGLVKARLAIQQAIITHKHISTRKEEFVPRGPVYRNEYAFHQLSRQYDICRITTVINIDKHACTTAQSRTSNCTTSPVHAEAYVNILIHATS